MRRVLISCSLMCLCSLAQETAAATQCSDIYPEARIGPPPEWTFWGDGAACFVRWSVASASDEDKLLERCRSTPEARFVHFERSKGSGQSICIFKILDIAHPQEITGAPASKVETSTEVTNSELSAVEKETNELDGNPHQQGDPNRLAATLVCSSIRLGNYKHCVGEPRSLGSGQFAFSVKDNCREGAIAAIAITDAKGRCIRRVTTIPAGSQSVTIESAGVPSVLDAIRFQPEVFECYDRRHDNISCDGNTDYSDPRSSSQIVVNLAALENPAAHKSARTVTKARKKQAKLKKRRKKVVVTNSVPKTSKQQQPAPKKWKPKEKRKPDCPTTIWQCSPG